MLRRTRTPRNRPGLTLLEVIISLAIFLFSLVAIGHLMTMGTQRASDAKALSRATQLCQGKLSEVIAGVLPLSSQGETAFDEEPDYVWSVECQQDSIANLWDVQVKVTRANKDAGNNIEVVLQQMVLDPTVRGSASDVTVSTDTGTPSSAATSGSSGSNQQGGAAAGGSGGAAGNAAKGGAASGAASGTTNNSRSTTPPAATTPPSSQQPPATNNKGTASGSKG
jgi:type II secretory pathway pseudopilin PulG